MSSYGMLMEADRQAAVVARQVDQAVLPPTPAGLYVRHGVAGFAAAGALMVAGGVAGAVLLGRFVEHPEILAWLPWTVQIAISAAQIAAVVLIAAWAAPDRWRAALGMLRPAIGLWSWIGIALVLFVVKAAVTMVVGALFGGASAETVDALRPFAETMSSNVAPMLVAAAVLGAIAEEVVFRGALSPALERSRLGFWGGSGLAALIWAAAHPYYPLPALAVLAALGMTLSWVRQRTGSILPGMAWHIANNVLALGAMGLILAR